MTRSVLFALFILGQAAALLAAGAATLWWSGDLMRWLIWLIGEERALGARNVIRLENGATYLTNPTGMIKWSLPFWFLGFLQITAALTLVGLWVGRRTARRSGPRPPRLRRPS